ncbi:STAS domain-containing protein [Nocardia cyriacigeorgica]|uniref:STAS domain-containing protein n=1 Tax=Nocardia cyriacigeorgica TaxID=135487 RepID=A0A6P1D4U8_9NOCA|nr:STAS domain-containing protein [Nocardia cyriacigeorgica]NEW39770.1 STAS domain-containing protein [Nocardia cyriacigeorgica]NEW45497.1 STAS domain-containing protein [Nocardia cyriacigeorgica]NEW52404.1 STAS domain-containing protein [Nocardia cyriacigeorgica]NEW59497.1 STAS domain-containing protein [Nocardia cyriacigeorgica]
MTEHQIAEQLHRLSRPQHGRDIRRLSQHGSVRGRCAVARVEGELDAALYDDFYDLLLGCLYTDRRIVVLDLRAATFMSIRSAALLVSAKADAAARGVDLRLVCGRKDVERVLDLAGVRPLFCHYPTMEAALDN